MSRIRCNPDEQGVCGDLGRLKSVCSINLMVQMYKFCTIQSKFFCNFFSFFFSFPLSMGITEGNFFYPMFCFGVKRSGLI